MSEKTKRTIHRIVWNFETLEGGVLETNIPQSNKQELVRWGNLEGFVDPPFHPCMIVCERDEEEDEAKLFLIFRQWALPKDFRRVVYEHLELLRKGGILREKLQWQTHYHIAFRKKQNRSTIPGYSTAGIGWAVDVKNDEEFSKTVAKAVLQIALLLEIRKFDLPSPEETWIKQTWRNWSSGCEYWEDSGTTMWDSLLHPKD
ncbi:MAG: hypothetical protein JNN11_00555 [Candidatus Doudnabacteria bacterium]|nr:hypothetical protein [Candidatus Doudnabacteria bacterium]